MSNSNSNLKIEDDGRTDYNYIINYLLKTVNNKEEKPDNETKQDKPVFLFEFFIFDLYIPKEVLDTLKQPLLSFRLLDFPTQTLEGRIDKQKQIVSFQQGKSCFFEMETHYLKEYLINEPLYIMLVDMNFGDMKILGSSKVNISIFSYDSFLNYSANPPRSRRNVLKLYDNTMANIAEFDIALLIRREYFAYEKIIAPPKYETHIHLEPPKTYEHPIEFNEVTKASRPKQFYTRTIQKEDMMKEISTMKETGINTGKVDYRNDENVKLQDTQYQEMLNPTGKNYTKNLKELIQGTQNNPPPLFFHNKREHEQAINNEIVVKVVNDNSLSQHSIKEKEVTKPEVVNKKDYISIPKLHEPKIVKQIESKKPQIENYDKKMKDIGRYQTTNQAVSKSHSNNSSKRSVSKPKLQKDFFEDDYQPNESNEYYKIFNKVQPVIAERVPKPKKEEAKHDKFNNFNLHSSTNLKKDPVVCQSIESIQYASMKESRDYEVRTSAMLNIIGSSKELHKSEIKESIMISDQYKSIEEESNLRNIIPEETRAKKSEIEDYGSFDYVITDSKI
jgi:hypothetical protein